MGWVVLISRLCGSCDRRRLLCLQVHPFRIVCQAVAAVSLYLSGGGGCIYLHVCQAVAAVSVCMSICQAVVAVSVCMSDRQ